MGRLHLPCEAPDTGEDALIAAAFDTFMNHRSNLRSLTPRQFGLHGVNRIQSGLMRLLRSLIANSQAHQNLAKLQARKKIVRGDLNGNAKLFKSGLRVVINAKCHAEQNAKLRYIRLRLNHRLELFDKFRPLRLFEYIGIAKHSDHLMLNMTGNRPWQHYF